MTAPLVRVAADEPEQVAPVLGVRDLRVSFPAAGARIDVVRSISFDVQSGERLGIVGESGSGKSLTALSIMRLVHPPGHVFGEIRLDGVDLLGLSAREMTGVRGSKVAMIYQNPLTSLNPLKTIGDQIVEAIRAHQQVSKVAARGRAIQLLAEVGVQRPAERFDSYPHEFSGGMQQRAMIAMALSADPKLLIADEITSALDVTTQDRIIELLSRIVEERKTAVIFITHDLAVAAGFCTSIQVMYAGRIVERADARSFYSHPVHPYSEALLRSICSLELDVEAPIAAIPGQPPLPSRLPSGCTFNPRCAYSTDLCHAAAPPAIQLQGGTHVVECHFADERSVQWPQPTDERDADR